MGLESLYHWGLQDLASNSPQELGFLETEFSTHEEDGKAGSTPKDAARLWTQLLSSWTVTWVWTMVVERNFLHTSSFHLPFGFAIGE